MAQTMFGNLDPALVQQAIQQEQQKSLMTQAQMDPAAYLRYSAGLRGQMLGQGVGELFGIANQDPRLKMARDAQEAYSEALSMSGGDASSPAFFKAFANSAAKRNLAPLAQQASSEFNRLSTEQEKLGFARQAAEETKYKNNPELLLQDALALPETDPKRTALLTRYSQIAEDRNFGIAKRQADLAAAQADLAKTKAETERISLITDEMRSDKQGNKVNNNGVRIGTFDKTGRYKAPDGTVYSAKAVETARTEHDAASDLLFRLERLTDSDINNAYGSAMDYTTVPGGGLISNTKTYSAQTKINEVGIRSVLNNLQQLKGPSSDKEMAQMIKDFPGYQADPDVMKAWVNRAVQATNRYLKRNEGRYGFDTDYGVENRFKTSEEKRKKRTEGETGDWKLIR